jgi:hypothetical protein
MRGLKNAEELELKGIMDTLTPEVASQRRMAAFSNADNSSNHRWHSDPFNAGNHILYYIMTGKLSDVIKEERQTNEAL